MTKAEKFLYPAGIMGQNMIFNLMSMYILFFFTDILGIDASVAGKILLFASLWDVINDPIMGAISDRTRTRFGAYRPYLLFGSFPLGIITVLCFVSFPLTGKALIALAATLYILWGMTYTASDIPIWALASVSSADETERTDIITRGKIGAVIGVVAVTVLSIPVLRLFGGERKDSAYTAMVGIFALVGVSLMFLLAIKAKERVAPGEKKSRLVDSLSALFRNKPFLLLAVAIFALNAANSIKQSAQIYFAIYTLGSASYVTPLGVALVIGMITGMLATTPLSARFDKKWVCIVSSLASAILSLIPYTISQDSFPLCFAINLFIFGLSGISMVITTTLLIDTIDYAERKLGYRSSGIIFSANTFLVKLGATASRWIISLTLTHCAYVKDMAPTPVLSRGMAFLVYIIPAIAYLVIIPPLVLFSTKD